MSYLCLSRDAVAATSSIHNLIFSTLPVPLSTPPLPLLFADARAAVNVQKRVAAPCPGGISFFVNFPSTMGRIVLDRMLVDGIGADRFDFEIITDDAPVIDLVDLEMLPKAIGGTSTSFHEHPKLSAFLRGL